MTITVDLETMTFRDKMKLVAQVLNSCDSKLDLTANEKRMLDESMLHYEKHPNDTISLSELDKKIRSRYE
jgi:hypothetical protein